MSDTEPSALPEPYPSTATLRAIEVSTVAHEALVESQLKVLSEHMGAVEREAKVAREGLRELLVQRIDDIDRANVILAENVNRVPTQLQVAIAALTELQEVKFAAVRAQADGTARAVNDRFELLDKQTVREKAAADLALAAAFDAQKEAAAATNNANAEAIRKSELATAETIKTNAEAQRAGQQSLSDKIDDLKDRLNIQAALITAIQTARATAQETHHDQRGGSALNMQYFMGIIAALSLIAVVVIAVLR
jgi:hypothetical protein